MTRLLLIEYRIALPDNVHDQGDVIALTKEPCKALNKALEDGGIAYDEKSFTVVKRGPKGKAIVPPPQLSLAPTPPDAAE
jgi:hypothetical protein